MESQKYPTVLTIAQRKGGVSKTTTSRYVSEYFARYKQKRVLSIDLDNQCNLSQLLIDMDSKGDTVRPPIHPGYDPVNNPEDREWGGRGSSADLFLTGTLYPYEVTQPKPIPNWDVCPGDAEGLYKLEHHPDTRVRDFMRELLRENLSSLHEEYDLIVIDTGPMTTGLMLAAIHAATHVLIPFIPEPQCAKGLGEMLGIIRRENEARHARVPQVNLLGILPSKVKRTAVHTGILGSMKDHPTYSKHMIPHWVPDRTIFPELDANRPVPSSIFDTTDKENRELKATMERLGEYIDQQIFGAAS